MRTDLLIDSELGDALRFVGGLLGEKVCWFYRGSFHFTVNGDYTVSITPESAGRLRVSSCFLTIPRDTKWTTATDRARLALLVREAAAEQTAVA